MQISKLRGLSALAVYALALNLAQVPAMAQASDSDPGARMPWDFPLPPHQNAIHPEGAPPNPKPPEANAGPHPSVVLLRQAAEAALAACEAEGLKVAVVALDGAGDIRIALTAQNVAPGKVYIAARKGLTAIEFARPTSQVAPLLREKPELQKRLKPQMALFAGGVPLLRNGVVQGAIAASGAKALQDEHCAAVGAASIAGKL